MRFYREGLLVSFTRIMTDEAVSSWRLDIHKCILRNCERLIELCVLKLDDEWFPMLDLLALVLNPTNKFHIYNASRHPEFPRHVTSYNFMSPLSALGITISNCGAENKIDEM